MKAAAEKINTASSLKIQDGVEENVSLNSNVNIN